MVFKGAREREKERDREIKTTDVGGRGEQTKVRGTAHSCSVEGRGGGAEGEVSNIRVDVSERTEEDVGDSTGVRKSNERVIENREYVARAVRRSREKAVEVA